MADKGPNRFEALANVRTMYPQYKDMSDDDLGNALAAKYPDAYGFLKQEAKPAKGPADSIEPAPGTLEAQTAMVGRMLTPIDRGKEPVSVLGFTPSDVGNAVLPPMVTAPTIAAGGEIAAGAGVAPAIGRAVTSGLIGGAKAIGKGVSTMTWDAIVDTLTAGAGETAGALASHLKIPKIGWKTSLAEKAGRVAGAAVGREGGTKKIDVSWDLVKDRIPKGTTFTIPAIDPKKALTPQEIIAGLKKLDDPQFTMAKDQFVSALNQAEAKMAKAGARVPGGPAVVKPFAGSVFGKNAPTERFTYGGTKSERILDRARNYAPAARAAIDAEATPEVIPGSGIPRGVAVPLAAGERGFEELARHLRPTF